MITIATRSQSAHRMYNKHAIDEEVEKKTRLATLNGRSKIILCAKFLDAREVVNINIAVKKIVISKLWLKIRYVKEVAQFEKSLSAYFPTQKRLCSICRTTL